MKTDDLLRLLAQLDRRLATIADQAQETREQAQHTLDRLGRLRQDLESLRQQALASAETSDSLPATPDEPG